MARKPSERYRRIQPDTSINLTSLMDIITNIMFFLLMFVTAIPIAMIDAPLPKVATTAEEVRRAQDATNKLDLTIYITSGGFSVKSMYGSQSLGLINGMYPYEALHRFLVQTHQRNAGAKEVTLMPSDEITYDVIIQTMDYAREYTSKDAGYKQIPPEIAQKPESLQYNRLFPEVSIGGV